MSELTLFPASVFSGLIIAALGLTAFAVVSLLVLLVRDFLRKSIW